MALRWLHLHELFVSQPYCKTCGQSFTSAEQRQAHAQTHHSPWGYNRGEGPRYLCNVCDGLFDSRDELVAHQYRAHGFRHPDTHHLRGSAHSYTWHD